MVTLIYRFPFSNYLREEIDERFDLLDLNRFGGLPGGGPGAPFKTRGRVLGDWFAGITRGGCILVFSVWGWALSAWHLNSPLRYLAFVLLLEWRLLRSQNFSHLNRYRYKMLRALQSACFSTAQVAKYCSYQTSRSSLKYFANITKSNLITIVLFSSEPSHRTMNPSSTWRFQMAPKFSFRNCFRARESKLL